MSDDDIYMMRRKVELSQEWRGWLDKIPSLKFDSSWDVKIIPPFSGAMVRFWIDKGDNHVSVYLDCFEELGCFGEPYWEIYPYKEDVYRVKMNDTKELMLRITEALDETEE